MWRTAQPTSATLYATRAMIAIAHARGRRITSATIGQQHAIPSHFLDHLLARLSRAALVSSLRGPHGGYVLARRPEHISLADIVAAIDGTPALEGDQPLDGCAVLEAWDMAASAMDAAIRAVTLDMLARRQADVRHTGHLWTALHRPPPTSTSSNDPCSAISAR